MEQLANEPVKIVYKESNLDLVTINCKRLVDPYEIRSLGSQEERDLAYERIRHSMEREMFEYIVKSGAFKIYEEFDDYEYKEKFIERIQVMR